MKIHKKTSTEVWLKGENTADFIRMKLIKSHKEFGNFYVFNSVFSMPYQRQAMFNLINQYNQLGIDKDELIASNIEILKLLESKEAGYDMKIYNKVAEIIKTAKSFWDYQKTSMFIIGLLIIPESELDTIEIFDQEKVEQNLKNWSIDTDMMGFFLNIAQQKCNSTASKLELDTQNYLLKELNLSENQTLHKGESLLKKAMSKIKDYFTK